MVQRNGVIDQFERGPLHTWSLSLTYARASARLRGLVRGTFEGIEVLKRGFSPRIISAYVLGSRGRTLVSGAQLAGRLGLYDMWAHFSVRDGTAVVAEPDRSGRAPAASETAQSGATAPGTGAQPEAQAGVQPSGGSSAAGAAAGAAGSAGGAATGGSAAPA